MESKGEMGQKQVVLGQELRSRRPGFRIQLHHFWLSHLGEPRKLPEPRSATCKVDIVYLGNIHSILPMCLGYISEQNS